MLRTTSICFSYMLNYIKSLGSTDESLDTKNKNLLCLNSTLKKYGGLLSKISQMLCYEQYTDNVFSECKPVYRKKTINYIKEKYTNKKLDKGLTELDFKVIKSGSVGQIHKGIFNGKPVIMKVLYKGLKEQTKEDLKIVETIAKYMYSHTDLKDAMEDISNSIYMEFDFEVEKDNQEKISLMWKDDDDIVIPEIIPELCSSTELGMYFLKGPVLNDYIDSCSSEQKNKICEILTKFLFKNLYKDNILYSDVHGGNFIIEGEEDDFKLAVLDFGCIQYIDDNVVSFVKQLHLLLSNPNFNEDEFFQILGDNEIIRKDDLSDEEKEYCLEFFKLQYEPFTSEYFEFNTEWLKKISFKDVNKMKKWNLPKGMVFFNRFTHGLFCLYSNLNFKGSPKSIIEQYL